ncbi:MAG TPA: hypothetical protein PKA63_09945 [Oligoflexia bacterium]|nr:hypothetical protein [Oligoflexia bacterium]HMP48977.1 hypothetical protein [Oligoflexia bacterium]
MKKRQNHHTVSESIVLILTSYPDLSVNEIHNYCSKFDKMCSLKAVYKELAYLQSEGKILKSKSKYRLHISFVSSLLDQRELLEKNYIKNLTPEIVLNGKNRKTYALKNLLRLNDLWSNISLSLLSICTEKKYYSWNPHSWFFLFHEKQEIRFFNTMNSIGVEAYKMIGGNTYIDRLSRRTFIHSKLSVSWREGPFSKLKDTYLTIIDDYIISARLSGKATHAIDDLCYKVKTANHLATICLPEFGKDNYASWLTVERNKPRAEKMKKKFREFFA